MVSLLDQNKLVPCPKMPEEGWKRTNPQIFFLPESEVLNFQGQSAMENCNKLTPWKVNFRDFQNITSVLQKIEKAIGNDGISALKQEEKRLVVLEINHGLADVYVSPEIKSQLEFKSTPHNGTPVFSNSAIAHAMASRLKYSSPHSLNVSFQSHQNEELTIVVVSQGEPNFTQSYTHLCLHFQKQTKAQLLMIEGGSAFSLTHHEIQLEEGAQVKELWLNHSENHKTVYSERLVTLAEKSAFYDAQLFVPKATMRVNSNIVFQGPHALSRSGAVVLAHTGKFDYEPVQTHNAPHGESDLKLNMVLNNKARASFQGLVVAEKQAQKTSAKQENINIVLSKQCRVDAEPRLEILPHDISCKHGSATGEIDKKQLYYLKSRGFSQEQAQQLILKGFAQSAFSFLEEGSVLEKIAESCFNHATF